MPLTLADAHTLLTERLAALDDDWTADSPLPSGDIECGNLSFPLHQLLAAADPGLRLLHESAYQVDFRLPRLGESWQVAVDTLGAGSWQIRMDDRNANGYAFTGRAYTLNELTDLLAQCRDRIAELAKLPAEQRTNASRV